MTSIGLVGTGKWGINWARALHRLAEVDFRWCCDLSESRLDWVRQQFPGVRTTTDIQQIFDDQKVQGLVIATSAPTHYKLAMKALDHGRHVMVEKPLTLTSEDAGNLVKHAREKNSIVMVGHLLEYHPAIRYIKSLLDSGQLGDIHYIYSQRLNLGTVRKDENAWWSLAPHDISVACRLLGQAPESVCCQGQAVVQPDVADVVFASLKFPDNRICHIHVSWLDPHKTRKLTVVGSNGMVTFDDTKPTYQVSVFDKRVSINNSFETYADWVSMHQGDIVFPQIKSAEPLLEEAKHFVECIRTGSTPISDGISGLQVVSVLEKGDESLRLNGVRVDIPKWSGPTRLAA